LGHGSVLVRRAVVCSCVGGEFTLWSATQVPHILRLMLAVVTGIPEQNIRVIAPDVGGGFGSKLQVTAEEVLAVLIARKLGRPVKRSESRSEGNMTVHHGRDQWQRLRARRRRRRPDPRPGGRPARRHVRCGPPPRTRTRAPSPRPICTGPPTTGGIWRGC